MENNKILVIDDWKPLLTVTRSFLEKNGYEVQVCSNPKEGVEMLKGSDVDILIVDVMMPEMSGFEVVEFVRNELKRDDLKIIIATGRSDPLDYTIAKNAGADGFVPKPFTKDELLETIKGLYE